MSSTHQLPAAERPTRELAPPTAPDRPARGLHGLAHRVEPFERAGGTSPGQALLLQRMVGNRAVVELLGYPRRRAPAPAPGRCGDLVLQRQVLSKLALAAGPDLVISDVVIGGRTPSPFPGTMGAHSTAWVAHIDELRRVLVNRPLRTAAAALLEFTADRVDETGRTLGRFTESVGPDQQNKIGVAAVSIARAHVGLTESLDAARGGEAEKETETETSVHRRSIQILAVQRGIQKLIDAYLTYVNYLPGTTVRGGDPRGHGEGPARGTLNQFEYVYGLWRRANLEEEEEEEGDVDIGGIEGPLLERAIDALGTGTFDALLKRALRNSFDPGSNDRLKASLADDLWTMFASETPEIFAEQLGVATADVLAPLVANFIGTIRRAYPGSFTFTGMGDQRQQVDGLRRAAAEAKVALPPGQLAPQMQEAAFRTNAERAEVGPSDIAEGSETFAVTVLLAPGGEVGDVVMIGRTTSPFSGTMGYHTTAWAAHLDAVRRLCTGRELARAVEQVARTATAALKDPSLEYAGRLDEKHKTHLVAGYNDLAACLGRTVADEPHESVGYLEKLIRDYLTFVNFLPMSTVQGGGVPGGRSEALHRGLLNAYEADGLAALTLPEQHARPGETLRTALLGLVDRTALRYFPPDLGGVTEEIDWTGRGFGEGHPLRKQLDTRRKVRRHRKLELVYGRLLATLGEAYPQAVRDADLASWLEADLASRLKADVGTRTARVALDGDARHFDDAEATDAKGKEKATATGGAEATEPKPKRRRLRKGRRPQEQVAESTIDLDALLDELRTG